MYPSSSKNLQLQSEHWWVDNATNVRASQLRGALRASPVVRTPSTLTSCGSSQGLKAYSLNLLLKCPDVGVVFLGASADCALRVS
jgi:hypothetical protein